ncbi:hypothetical protein [Mesorhizobium onobrychidis]|uniref:Uncharacterized protein n=1 Tax=Mesorhizobium onobrychidis TaxID=2775404 RepID=A0ABY5R721_9HYPH|nr:hypothetical protein [Mesorhizobium onobrychidis]UVC19330.1 hypothetical protein IHQ72_36105 [Mesorhizobium onobrychidis]
MTRPIVVTDLSIGVYAALRPRQGVTQNGVPTPNQYTATGGLCFQAWDHFARCWHETTNTNEIVRRGVAKKLNRGNLTTELPRWKQHHGITA